MTTALDLIKSSLRKIHVLGTGATLPNEEAADALSALNNMLASWSVEGDLVFTETIETFNLTNGQYEYTIGTGGDFNTVRPIKIVSAYVTQDSTDYPLKPMDWKQYSELSDKDLESIPDRFYYNADYPLGKIRLFPAPTGVTSITVYSEKPLSSLPTLTTVISLPSEYEAAIIYNLAIWLAPEYEREASMDVRDIAQETKAVVMAQNNRNERNLSRVNVPSRGISGGVDRQSFIGGK